MGLFLFVMFSLTPGFFLSISHVNSLNSYSPNNPDDSSLNILSIVKRSTVNGKELTKTFKGNTKNNFNCVINFTDSPKKSSYILIDEITGLTVSTVNIQTNQTYSLSYSDQDYINVSIPSGVAIISYDFQVKAFSSQINKVVSIYQSGNIQINESACISPGTFNENLNSNLLVILFILLGLFIVFIVFLIVILCCKYRSNSDNHESPVNNGATYNWNDIVLKEDYQNSVRNNNKESSETTFINTLTEKDQSIIKKDTLVLSVNDAIKTDDNIKSDFKEYNRTVFQICLNNIVDKYPKLKTKVDDIRNRVFKRETELNETLRKEIEENIKKIMNESINLNKMNLDYLTNNQEEEREKVLKHTASNDKEKVKNDLEKIFEQERRDLIIQLKVNQDLDMERFHLSKEENVANQLNETYLSAVIEILSNESNPEGSPIMSPKDSNEILNDYFRWQQQLQLIKESEKIRQIGRLEYTFHNRANLVKQKVIEIQNVDEIIDKKSEYFSGYIGSLRDNEEIDHVTAREIVNEFDKYKTDLLKEMDNEKQKQASELMKRLNNERKSRIDELKMQHDNEINNLLASHNNDSDNKLMNENIINLEKKFYENIHLKEIKHDDEGTNEILKLYVQIGTQTKEKLDSKIKTLINELKSEGVSSEDINRILYDYDKRSKTLKMAQDDEKTRQMNAMKENLLKSKQNIDKNVIKQINEKQQFDSENNISDELLNIQKILSEEDRNYILKEYNKHKLFTQTSITSSFLEQRKKMEEALAIKKAKKFNELKENHEKKIEDMVNRKMKNKTQKSEDEIKGECEKDLIVEYLNKKLQVLTFSDWKNDLDKELEVIQNDLITERAVLLKKKEEESVAAILLVQFLKAKETVELKEQEEKIFNLQLAALESNQSTVANSQEIFKSYEKSKNNLQDELDKTKLLQEMAFKKNLENKRKGLLRGNIKDNDNEIKKSDKEDLHRKNQDFAFQKLKDENKLERSKQLVEKDLLKKFINSSNCSREDVFYLMMEIYPFKSNQDIEILVEEFYPKSKQQSPNIQPRSGISLLETYRKYKDKNPTNSKSLNDFQNESKNYKSNDLSNNYDNKPENSINNLKDFSKNNFKEPPLNNYKEPSLNNSKEPSLNNYKEPSLNNYKEPLNTNVGEPDISFKSENEIYKENVLEDNPENTRRKKKKKRRRKLLTDEMND